MNLEEKRFAWIRGFGHFSLRRAPWLWNPGGGFYVAMARSVWLISAVVTGRAGGWGSSLYLSSILKFQGTPDVFITSESL